MNHPIIVGEAVKLHIQEIEGEMSEWRLAKQAKTAIIAGPLPLNRFRLASETFLKQIVLRLKAEYL